MSYIKVDPRSGSGEFLNDLVQLTGGKAQHAALSSADFAWEGAGPDGRPVLVGVERKTVGDALQCISDGRFAGSQLPKLQAEYEIAYLLIEGTYYRLPNGNLALVTYGSRWKEMPWKYATFVGWWHTMVIKGGMIPLHTSNPRETVALVAGLFHWWSTPYSMHCSHKAFERSRDPEGLRELVSEASDTAKVYAALPGIGPKRASALLAAYPSVQTLVSATLEELSGVTGKALGAKLYAFLHGGAGE